MACSSWWCGVADMTGVAAGMAVVLTVVPSLGRRARRKWSYLVVVWQLGGGEGGEGEKSVKVEE